SDLFPAVLAGCLSIRDGLGGSAARALAASDRCGRVDARGRTLRTFGVALRFCLPCALVPVPSASAEHFFSAESGGRSFRSRCARDRTVGGRRATAGPGLRGGYGRHGGDSLPDCAGTAAVPAFGGPALHVTGDARFTRS